MTLQVHSCYQRRICIENMSQWASTLGRTMLNLTGFQRRSPLQQSTNALPVPSLENDSLAEHKEALGHSYIMVVTVARRLARLLLAAHCLQQTPLFIAGRESVRALVVCHGSNIHGNLRYGVHHADGTTQKLPIEDLPGGPQGQHYDGEDGLLEETHDSEFNWGSSL